MKKTLSRISLNRETLRLLNSPALARVFGGGTVITAPDNCVTTCNCTVTCRTDCAGITCLPCTNGC